MFKRFVPRRFLLAAAVLSSCVSPILAADKTDRAPLIRQIERIVQTRYVVVEKRAAVLSRLAAGLKSGRYDTIDDRAFATRVTEDLKAVTSDRHVYLIYDPAKQAQLSSSPGLGYAALNAQSGDAAEQFRRENQGLVEQRILEGNVRYLNITAFDWTTGVTGARYDDAMRFLRDGDAIVIDLRQNPGGFPDAVHYLLSHFVEPDTLLVTFQEGDKATPMRSLGELPAGRIKGKPLYILTSSVTASAAEELAYQVVNRKLGEVVGETTAGAGNQSDVFSIAPGFVLSVSTARAIDALTNDNWEGVGVKPTIAAPVASALAIAHVRALELLARNASAPDQRRLAWETRIARARVQPPTFSASALAPYAGDYGERHATVRGDALFWQRGSQPEIAMQPLGDDWFLLGGTGGQAHFVRRDGGYTSVIVSRPDGDGAAIPRTGP